MGLKILDVTRYYPAQNELAVSDQIPIAVDEVIDYFWIEHHRFK